jgi:hypothetical protein
MPPTHLIPHIIAQMIQHTVTPILASRYLSWPTRRLFRVRNSSLHGRFSDTACAQGFLVTLLATGTQVGKKVVAQRWIQWVMEMGLQLRNFNLFLDARKRGGVGGCRIRKGRVESWCWSADWDRTSAGLHMGTWESRGGTARRGGGRRAILRTVRKS